MIHLERILVLGAVYLFALSAWRPTASPNYALAASQEHNYIDTTVCEMVAHPEQFNDRLVRVQASVGSDGIEHTGLEDEDCPGKGVALSVSSEDERRDQTLLMSALHEAIFRLVRPGTSEKKKIHGTFLGKFATRPKDFPPRIFFLKKVVNLTIRIEGD